jgi:hypothetical protein
VQRHIIILPSIRGSWAVTSTTPCSMQVLKMWFHFNAQFHLKKTNCMIHLRFKQSLKQRKILKGSKETNNYAQFHNGVRRENAQMA